TAKVGVVGIALDAALRLLFELQLTRDVVKRSSGLGLLLHLRRLRAETGGCFFLLPVGDRLGSHLIERAVVRAFYILDLIVDEAVVFGRYGVVLDALLAFERGLDQLFRGR